MAQPVVVVAAVPLLCVWLSLVAAAPPTAVQRVGIVSVFHGDDFDTVWARTSVHSLQCYASRHGYTFLPRVAPALDDAVGVFGHSNSSAAAAAGVSGSHLAALGAVQSLLAFQPRFDWLLLLEAGTVVTNPGERLEPFIRRAQATVSAAPAVLEPLPDAHSFDIPKQCTSPGTTSLVLQGGRVLEEGAILVANTPCAEQLLKAWRHQLTTKAANSMPAYSALYRSLIQHAMNHSASRAPRLGLATCVAPGNADTLQGITETDSPVHATRLPVPLIHRLADMQCVRSSLIQLGYTYPSHSTAHIALLAPASQFAAATSRASDGGDGPRLATRSAVGDAFGANNREPSGVWRPGDVFLLPSELPGSDGSPGLGLPTGSWPRDTQSCTCADGDDDCVGSGTQCVVEPCLSDIWTEQDKQWKYGHTNVWAGYRDKVIWRDHMAMSAKPVVTMSVIHEERRHKAAFFMMDHVSSRAQDFLHSVAFASSPGYRYSLVESVFAKYGPKMSETALLEWVDFERDAAAFVVQVGSMLDDDDDELHKRMASCEWPALIVEPLGSRYLQALRRYHKCSPQLEQSAIALQAGTAMLNVLPSVDVPMQWPGWATAFTSLHSMANVLPRQVDNATLVEELVAAAFPVSVTVRRLADVLAEQRISRIDVMDIHVGGSEILVVEQLAEQGPLLPLLVRVCIRFTPPDEVGGIAAELRKRGYLVWQTEHTLLAAMRGGTLQFDDVQELMRHIK